MYEWVLNSPLSMTDEYGCSAIVIETSFDGIHLVWKRLFPLFFVASLINVFHNTMYSSGSWPPKLFLASISFLAGSVFWDVTISTKMSWSAKTVRTTTICFFSHQDILLVTDFPYFFPRVLLEPIQRKLASHPCYQLVIKDVFQFSKI